MTTRTPMPAHSELERECRNCGGAEWVCENHRDMSWSECSSHPDACGCGAGAPCPVCNWRLANSALIEYLGIILGHDSRFQISIGGNPNAIDQKLDEMRRVYDYCTGSSDEPS